MFVVTLTLNDIIGIAVAAFALAFVAAVSLWEFVSKRRERKS